MGIVRGGIPWQRQGGIVVQAAVLLAAALVVLAIAGPLAAHFGGRQGLTAAAVAGALCWAGAAAGLVAGRLFVPNIFAALLAGMFFRMGVPLGFAVATLLAGGWLAQAGLLYYLLVFYPVTLTVETALSIPRRRDRPPAVSPSDRHDDCPR
jgi:hypothetical protein